MHSSSPEAVELYMEFDNIDVNAPTKQLPNILTTWWNYSELETVTS